MVQFLIKTYPDFRWILCYVWLTVSCLWHLFYKDFCSQHWFLPLHSKKTIYYCLQSRNKDKHFNQITLLTSHRYTDLLCIFVLIIVTVFLGILITNFLWCHLLASSFDLYDDWGMFCPPSECCIIINPPCYMNINWRLTFSLDDVILVSICFISPLYLLIYLKIK